MKIYLSLGSNLGDRLKNIERALSLLGSGGCRIIKRSGVYETVPLYYLEQPSFFNLAAVCETALSPGELISLISRIEKSLKRRRLFKNGPRTADIDILFYGNKIINLPDLQIPHPRLAEREFVLAPLSEISPNLRHPVSGFSPAKMLSSLKDRGEVQRLPETYCELEAWLKKLPPPAAQKHYSLEGIKSSLSRLGNPQKLMGKVLHMAGSTGKTSSACMSASALWAGGYKTGLYTSPHIYGPRERIRINGRKISEKDFLKCFLKVKSVSAGELSFFETVTAMAFLYFALKKTRFAVIEAGLGGGLDATNAADGAVAAITSISEEHIDLLGPNIKNIAEHKAGIIKKGAAVLIGVQTPPVATRVIERFVKAAGAKIHRPCENFLTAVRGIKDIFAGAGAFQLSNAVFALSAAKLAANKAGLKFHPNIAAKVLRRALPPGRFERFKLDGRIIVVDGAHNPEEIEALLKEFTGNPPVCVAAFMSDKALASLAVKLAGAASKLILTSSLSYRSANPKIIKKLLSPKMRRKVEVENSPMKALSAAIACAPEGGTVLVTGSLYLAGDILAGLKGLKAFHPREMLV